MNNFSQLLSNTGIQYREIQENTNLKKFAVKLKHAYIIDDFLSVEFILLLLFTVASICFYISAFVRDDFAHSIGILIAAVILCILTLTLITALIFFKAETLFCHRKIYYIKDGNSEIIDILKENAVQKRWNTEGNICLYSKIYELVFQNKKVCCYPKAAQKDDTFFIILFEDRRLCESPILLIPKSVVLSFKNEKHNNSSQYALKKFLFKKN